MAALDDGGVSHRTLADGVRSVYRNGAIEIVSEVMSCLIRCTGGWQSSSRHRSHLGFDGVWNTRLDRLACRTI